MLGLVEECRAIAAASGFEPRPAATGRAREALTAAGSAMAASMSRDVAAGARVEADHVIGDLIERGRSHGLDPARLATAYTHLKAYEARRSREG